MRILQYLKIKEIQQDWSRVSVTSEIKQNRAVKKDYFFEIY